MPEGRKRPRKKHDAGDPPGRRIPDDRLEWLFDEFDGRLISPGGVAAMLGLSRQRVHQLIEDGQLRCFRSENVEQKFGPFKATGGTRWAYVPLEDVKAIKAAERPPGRHRSPLRSP